MKTYPYERLSDAAKGTALEEWVQQDNWEWFDDECVKRDFIEDGVERGFDIREIYWSGFWSQCDGASWEGHISPQKWIAYKITQHAEPSATLMAVQALVQNASDVLVKVGRTSYCHDGTMLLAGDSIFEFDACIEGGIFDGANAAELYRGLNFDLPKVMIEDARAWARDIYKALEAEYEYQTTAEHFAEMCDVNDWLFDSRGHFVRINGRKANRR